MTDLPVLGAPGVASHDEDEPRALASRPPVEPERGRYFIHTWGCQMNVHDSERMAGQLEALGFSQARDEEDADVILLNTCTVRETSASKVYGKLGDLRRLKRQREHLVVGVCGCLAQQERDGLFTRAPHLDLVIGPRAIPFLGRHVGTVLARRERVRDTAPHVDAVGEGSEESLRQSFPKAYLTVQEGCDKFCTFCVVPFTRGREKCRPIDVLVAEAAGLGRRGFREIELLGQNVNCYRDEDGSDLADLVLAIAEIPGVERIRFVTSHPRHLSDRIADVLAHPKVMDGIHLPVQSGSDAVLARMERDYTRADYLERVARLRSVSSDLALQTDIIVGFPGETEADFEQTLSIVEEVGYEGVYSFKYSPRPFTKASRSFADDVPDDVKAERLERLQRLQDALQAPRDAARVGRVEDVLIDGMSKRSDQDVSGRTSRNRVVNLPGSPDLIGLILPTRIVAARAHSFRGEPAGPPR
jgi:tRNA-2-methylthio-N6-dimethylallyladenosine synthase